MSETLTCADIWKQFRSNKGKCIILPTDEGLKEFLTADLVDKDILPGTSHVFSLPEKAYIRFHHETCLLYQDKLINYREHFEKFLEYLEHGTSAFIGEAGDIPVRFLSIYEIQSHFIDFDSSQASCERYERFLAERALIRPSNDSSRTWLLRHSSLNRTLSSSIDFGRKYYVLSFRYDPYPIQHVLFAFYPGFGWGRLHYIDKILEIKGEWSVSFIRFLTDLLYKYDLSFSSHLKTYFQI